MDVVAWRDAVARITAPDPTSQNLTDGRRSRWHASPILVAGASGTGKTRLWSALTGRPADDAMSVAVDDGYMLRPTRRAAALTTIPGQWSLDRYALLGDYFEGQRRVSGVIFVVSNGFDRVWPKNVDSVAATLPTVDLRHLRERNLRFELHNFSDVCDAITERSLRAPQLAPRWVLVVVNKVDLYFDRLQEAEQRYLLGCGSEFSARAERLVDEVGALRLTYSVVPASVMPTPYRFNSARGSINVDPQLTELQCAASLPGVSDSIGELNAG